LLADTYGAFVYRYVSGVGVDVCHVRFAHVQQLQTGNVQIEEHRMVSVCACVCCDGCALLTNIVCRLNKLSSLERKRAMFADILGSCEFVRGSDVMCGKDEDGTAAIKESKRKRVAKDDDDDVDEEDTAASGVVNDDHDREQTGVDDNNSNDDTAVGERDEDTGAAKAERRLARKLRRRAAKQELELIKQQKKLRKHAKRARVTVQ
jgi:hypothetical protein